MIEAICPETIGERKFTLRATSHPQSAKVATFETLVLAIDYGDTDEGVVLPLEVQVTTLADRRAYERVVYESTAPAQVIVRPVEPGWWVVTVRELHHNRWWGSLSFEVVGSRA